MLTVLTFIVGLILGFGVYHFFFRLSHQEKEILNTLQETQNQFKTYRENVTAHLNQSAEFMAKIETVCDQFHDHILKVSVDLNQDTHKQSLLQPSLHPKSTLDHDDHEEEQVTEFHPMDTLLQAAPPLSPPKDYA
jgi:uncharacterized membrane-anchored protein YhcB (DUF1043 family)